MKIGTDGVQLLGGHGFIREHLVELWYRNLRAIAHLGRLRDGLSARAGTPSAAPRRRASTRGVLLTAPALHGGASIQRR